MPTPFDKVIDLALVTVNDYKLVKLYNQTEEGFKERCDAFLLSAVPDFFQCRQSLDYDEDAREFVSDLTNVEISILSDLFTVQWFKHETQDATRINALLQTSGGFKTPSASQNLKEKSAYLDTLREKVYQKITDYQLQDIDNVSL